MPQRFDDDVYVGDNLRVVGAYANNAEIKSTIDDTTTTLTVVSKEHQLLKGSGVMQWYDLGVATTYNETRSYNFYNATPQFVGIKNSNNSVWHRLPPRASCNCWLVDNSTAAGTWFSQVVESNDPAYGLSRFMDFTGYIDGDNLYSDLGLIGVKNGTLAGNGYTSSVFAGRQGIMYSSTGTDVNGWALTYSQGTAYVGAGARAYEVSQCLSDLSTVPEEFIARFGVANGIAGGEHTIGSYFWYDRYNGGGAPRPNWLIRNISGGGDVTVDTGVLPALVFQKLRVEFDDAGLRTDWFIDNAAVSPAGGLNTLLPPSVNTLRVANQGITKSAGNTPGVIYYDNVRIQSYPTTLR